MKYIKLFSLLLLTCVLIGCSSLCFLTYSKMTDLKKNYDIYMNEEADIQFELSGGVHSLSIASFYPKSNDYSQTFNNVLKYYELLAEDENVQDSFISYYLDVFFKNNGRCTAVGEERFEFEKEGILSEGRTFTQDELDQGSFVAIIKKEDHTLHLGDKIEIRAGYSDSLVPVEVEIIGFYDQISTDQNGSIEYDENRHIYMPQKAILNISRQWLNEIEDVSQMYDIFMPAGIMNPIYTCANEKDYEELKETISTYQKTADFSFDTKRLDDHYRNASDFDTSSLQKQFQFYLMLSVICLSFLVMFILYHYFVYKRQQQKYQKMIMKEQEKNVQNIIMINQDSHKLKHDLKHFLAQLSLLVQKDEKEKVLELLREYHGEIEALEIPAYTQNSTVDLLMNHYISKAKKTGIDFTYSSIRISDLDIADRKLYILLSNALDNAFVHCDNRKKVYLNIGYVEPYYRFVIINTCENETIRKKEPQADHGFGMISMKQIVKEAQGEITFEIKNHQFICTILIPATNLHK